MARSVARPTNPIETPIFESFLLGVDLGLDQIWFANIRERLTPALTCRLDAEIARTRQPLEGGLVEEHRVDSVKGDFDPVLGKNAIARNDPLGRDDELRRCPFGVSNSKRDQRGRNGECDDHIEREPDVSVDRSHDDEQTADDDHSEQRAYGDHRPPVRMHVDDDVFVLAQEVRRKSHIRRA